MLKQLWRKLGSEFSQSDLSDTDDGPSALSWWKPARDESRILPHMTHTGEFHLERLTSLVESRYGKTFNDRGDESIRELINFASRIQDQDAQRELLLFYLNCSPFIQEYLRSEEVLDGNHFLSKKPDSI